MAKDRLSGKLAVILHADVAGSTALVQQDKQLAHERIRDAFQRFGTTIEKYQGKVIEVRGDALLAEFERASDAVSAALSFQSDHTYHISRLKDDLRPTVRVGITIGEVIIADGTVTGAGVVQAQRIEQLADPGGVCITAVIHDALSKRMPFDFENLGEQELKGFDDPVRVYRVELSSGESVPLVQQARKDKTHSSRSRLMVVAIVIAMLAVGIIGYWFKTQEPKVEAASIERMAYPLPDKPSIAVLPFTNMSNDAEQDFFAYGMTDDLITDISKVSGLFVVSRNSVAKYKGKTVEIRKVAEELGVRYVMEGSVRRVGNDVRINAQLIDALSGGHEWAERYDGSLNDVFAIQDQIISSIVDELEIVLIGGEQAKLAENKTTNTDAYDAYLQGWERYRQNTPEDLVKAKSFFEQAINLDPEYSLAYSALAAVDWSINFNGWARAIGTYPILARSRSRKSLKKAMERPSALAYQVSSEMSALFYRKPDKALKEAEQAIKINANDPAGHLAMAAALLKAGKQAEAAKSVRTAMRHDPEFPAFYLNRLAQAQYQMGEFADAVETLETSAKRNPYDDWTFVYLVAAYGQLGDEVKAKKALEKANELRATVGWGALTIELAQNREGIDGTRYIFKWFGDLKSLRDGLRKAGVPNGNEWRNLLTRDDTGAIINGAKLIGSNTAKSLHERGVPFIDVFFLWGEKRIPGAHYLEMWAYDFNEVLLSKIVQKNQEVVLYSSRADVSGDRALNAVALAVTRGYEKVYFYKNGMVEWQKAGYPIDNKKIDVGVY
ncbi:MAG: tetratricopeptide repeat protein [Chloroflexi bacterium]|jgi:TolB-like protein/class 3 adenylate cyclase/predicted negative regulator of RcsB-dependent stress response/rhodanese-related sulfurtransferase|nr:tetratricopeptide repeat protein [Chloroflexota bacterium]